MIKVFGIGNPLLEDDGIGAAVAKVLKQEEQNRVEIFVTEIYVEEALDQIKEEDYIVILDAMNRNKMPGEISFFTFMECQKRVIPEKFCHDRNLLDTLLLFYPSINGELIGIQIAEITYKEELSFELNQEFPCIVSKISKHIAELVRERETDA